MERSSFRVRCYFTKTLKAKISMHDFEWLVGHELENLVARFRSQKWFLFGREETARARNCG